MRRKAPVTFGEGRLEKGRASDTTWKTQEGLSTERYLAGRLLYLKCSS
jgi:hypothetical protein